MRAKGAGGAPIAAHLALLVTIALVAAHLGTFIVVTVLPPRPPDLVRGDTVFAAFKQGFAAAQAGGRATGGDARWRIAAERPRGRDVGFASRQLAQTLGVEPDRVMVSFRPPARNRVLYRVQNPGAEGPPPGEPLGRPPQAETRHLIEGGPPGGPPPGGPAIGSGEPHRFESTPRGVLLMANFTVAARLQDGRWLIMRPGRDAETANWLMRVGLAIVGALVVLLLVALAFAQRIASPIARFSDAVQRVGLDRESAPVPEKGPRELRGAARAVNAMQERLQRLVAQRTEMLAAVAHDLRTPLMRLRLAAESADPETRDRLAKHTAELDALIGSFIAFARDDPTKEARVRLDLAALAQSAVDDRAGADPRISYRGPDRLVLMGQPVGLRRAIDNLIDNALKYGGAADVVVMAEPDYARVDVSDNGPGIALDERESVFRPFVRGKAAGDTPGAGLGLASAREIARAHGGDVVVAQRGGKGATVRLTLPL